jgi:dTMP kinase
VSSISDEVAALRGTRSATLGDLLRTGPFARLLAAMTVSSLGDWVGFVAVTTLVTRIGGVNAAIAVGGVMLARTLPAFLFGPFAGVFVDRLDRRKLMIVADIGRGILYLSMVLVQELWWIYLLSFLIECLGLVWGPARDATIPNLVPRRQLTNANSLTLVSTYGTLPLGGILFTILATASIWVGGRLPFLSEYPETLPLVLDAATFGFSALMLSRIAFPPQPRAAERVRLDPSRVWRDTVEGIRFLREDSIASAMSLGIVIAFGAVGAVLATGPVFITITLGADSAGWGVIVTATGVGMALGMVSANAASRVIERHIVLVWSLVACGGALLAFAATPTLAYAAVIAVWLGAFCGLAWVSGYTLLQENVADEYRGRTFAALTTLSRAVLFLSLAVFPALAQVLGAGSEAWFGGEFFVGGQRFDLSGTRLSLWLAAAILAGAGFFTWRSLARYRLSRPLPLAIVPKLKRPPATGLFIAFEGVEGAGKGTQVELAERRLRDRGVDVVVTREPGGTGAGERIRDLLLDPATGRLDPRTEALLFAAARAQTVSNVIRPALADGKVVICDRYIDSSLAYQGWARGLGEADVLSLNVWATQGLFPDLVLLLHVEPEQGQARQDGEPDRMEAEGQAFFAKVTDAYLRIAEEHPERFVVIDGSREAAVVADDVAAAIDAALAGRDASSGEP